MLTQIIWLFTWPLVIILANFLIKLAVEWFEAKAH
jgi:hypothetical protein